MKTLSRLLLTAVLAAAFGSAQAVVTYDLQIYGNDFSASVVDSYWSSSSPLTLTAPLAEDTYKTTLAGGSAIGQFLGDFGGTQSVNFSLTDSRMSNKTVTLTLDFLAIRSWDGGDPQWGPADSFMIVANGQTLLDKTFSNGAGRQTYTTDGSAPNGENDGPMSGSRARYALDYSFYDGIASNEQQKPVVYDQQNAIYGMIFSFSVGDDGKVDLTFSGHGLQDTWIANDPSCSDTPSGYCTAYRDESWGLDNISLALNGLIRIPGTEVPAPGTLAALCLGLVGLSFSRRRRTISR